MAKHSFYNNYNISVLLLRLKVHPEKHTWPNASFYSAADCNTLCLRSWVFILVSTKAHNPPLPMPKLRDNDAAGSGVRNSTRPRNHYTATSSARALHRAWTCDAITAARNAGVDVRRAEDSSGSAMRPWERSRAEQTRCPRFVTVREIGARNVLI